MSSDFLQDGEIGRPGLSDLASEGYYFLNSNYMQGLQAFCKGDTFEIITFWENTISANCFCKSGKETYGGSDSAIKAASKCSCYW